MQKYYLFVNRDAVCMGDDIDDHTKEIYCEKINDTYQFMEYILQNYDIPYMVSATWGVWLNNECIAKIESGDKIICLAPEMLLLSKNKLDFRYYTINRPFPREINLLSKKTRFI